MALTRPQLENLRLVFRLFVCHPSQFLGGYLYNLKTCLGFPCLGLNPIIKRVKIVRSVLLLDSNVSKDM